MELIKKLHRFVESKNKIYKIECLFLRNLISLWTKIRLWGRPQFGIYTKNKRKEKIIISLTSYPARFKTIVPTLKSLLNQTIKPDRIIVWLSCARHALTEDMIALEPYGIEYRCDVEDLKSHKKYYWAFQEFYSDLVITVDDDAIYPVTLVSSLLKAHVRHPDCVCARRVHKMIYENCMPLKYSEWENDCVSESEPSNKLIATGVGGVLYVPKLFCKDIFNVNAIKQLSLSADDIWLKYMEILSDIDVVWAKNYMPHPIEVDGTQDTALRKVNVNENRNDKCVNCILSIYGVEVEKHLQGIQ